VEVAFVRLNLIGHISPIIVPFAIRGLSRRGVWSASGDERGTKRVDSVQMGTKAKVRKAGLPIEEEE
jgi:hypothetical protein